MKIRELLVLFMLPFLAIGQDNPQNVVKINPFGPLANQYMLAYERVLGEKFSVQLAAGYIHRNDYESYGTRRLDKQIRGYILIPEARYYFLNKGAPKGLYLGGFARLRFTTETGIDSNTDPTMTDYDYTMKQNVVGGGLVAGYQFVIANVLVFDLFIGPQYKNRSSTRTFKDPNATEADFNYMFPFDGLFRIKESSGMGLRTGFNIGFSF
ncbi:MAG: DUF3575 domain-containing protein [Cytophagaceae bacterium]